MRTKLFLLPLCLTIFVAPAFAASSAVIANLKIPVSETKEAVAGDFIWRCVGTNCAIVSEGGSASPSVCHEFAKQFGQVVSFGSARRQFDPGELTTCNDGIAAK